MSVAGTELGASTEDQQAKPRQIAVRDSKDPDGPKLYFAVDDWKRFLDEVKAGKYDL